MIREKMDFEKDELVTYTPIVGAVYRRKMSEHGYVRMISLRNEHPPCSLFTNLLVGGLYKREISKVVTCLSNPKIHTGTDWNSLLVFVVRELVFLLLPKNLLSIIVWGYVKVKLITVFLSSVLLCVPIKDMREFCCVIVR
jgi:hypothetical protein